MKERIIRCEGLSAQDVIKIAEENLKADGFEVQRAETEDGSPCVQARKSSWIRNATGTSYAVQIVARDVYPGTIRVSAGWGKWIDKVLVGGFATFIALGVLIIPVIVGTIKQKNLPEKTLNTLADTLGITHPECKVFRLAKSPA